MGRRHFLWLLMHDEYLGAGNIYLAGKLYDTAIRARGNKAPWGVHQHQTAIGKARIVIVTTAGPFVPASRIVSSDFSRGQQSGKGLREG